jgi:endonuclease-8
VPEGDTVYRSARALNDVLAGQLVEVSDFRVPAFATVNLAGETVENVVSVGKHLLHRIGDVTVHSHLKMEGAWHLYRPETKWRRPEWQARAILAVPGWTAVGFSLGVLEVVPRQNEADVIGHLGPDILGDNWDPELAVRNLTADPDRPVGLALLDQRVIAGLGNVYRNELCFLRGVLPTRPVREVPDPAALVDLAHRVILSNRDRVERSTTGDLRPGRMSWVSQREGKPCLRCGTPIRRGSLGDDPLTRRDTFFCVVCQT